MNLRNKYKIELDESDGNKKKKAKVSTANELADFFLGLNMSASEKKQYVFKSKKRSLTLEEKSNSKKIKPNQIKPKITLPKFSQLVFPERPTLNLETQEQKEQASARPSIAASQTASRTIKKY